MRRWLLALIALLVALTFGLYMVTFTVTYTDVAVVPTFGSADAEDIVEDPGLKWKLPAPIQSTTVYDKRVRYLEARLEQQQTADDRQIVVKTFLTWRVDDPLVFFQRFSGSAGTEVREHYRKAEDTITSLLRGAVSEVSRYELGELFSPEPGASKLAELERSILERIQGAGSGAGEDQGGIASYGLAVEMVGINGVELTQDTTREVFDRMKSRREKLAAKAESEGTAAATAIMSESESDARRIRAFAELRAAELSNEGGEEASVFLAQLQEEPALAVFMKKIELMRNSFGKQSTFALPTSMLGLDMFSAEFMREVQQGRLPDPKILDLVQTGAAGGGTR